MFGPILVHNILAQSIVPTLEFVIQHFVHLEVAFYVTVAVETTAFVIWNNIPRSINIPITKVNPIIHAPLDDVIIKYAATASEYDETWPHWPRDVIVYHFHSGFFFHYYVGVFVFYKFVILDENVWFGVEIEACSFVLVDLIANDLNLLGISNLHPWKMILPYLIPEYARIPCHKHIYATFVAIVNFVFDQGATGIIADIDAAPSRAIDVVILCQEASALTSHHDPWAHRTTNQILD